MKQNDSHPERAPSTLLSVPHVCYLKLCFLSKITASSASWEITGCGSMEATWHGEGEDVGPRDGPPQLRPREYLPRASFCTTQTSASHLNVGESDSSCQVQRRHHEHWSRWRVWKGSAHRPEEVTSVGCVVPWGLPGSPPTSHWSPAHEHLYLHQGPVCPVACHITLTHPLSGARVFGETLSCSEPSARPWGDGSAHGTKALLSRSCQLSGNEH